MVSFRPLKISLWNACTVLDFFIAGFLSVALQARRPLGAYRIPLETGLLTPSEKLDGLNGSLQRLLKVFS
jgi:hypothetical protein